MIQPDSGLPASATPRQPVCRQHPASPADATCERCGDFACRSCITGGLCPRCDERLQVPFAERRERGFFSAYAATLKQCLTEPRRFARAVTQTPSLSSAVLFGGATAFANAVVVSVGMGGLFALIFTLAQKDAAQKSGPNLWVIPFVVALYGVLGMGGFAVFALVWSAVLRVATRIASIAIPFAALLRIVLYASAPLIVGWVPLVGIAAAAFTIVLTVFAISEAGKVSGTRATLAVLVPLVVLTLLFVAAWVVLMLSFGPKLAPD